MGDAAENDIRKILIRAPNWVGDVVMATPAFRCIRKNFPQSRITLLVKPYVRSALDGSPWFDELVDCGSGGGVSVKGVYGYGGLVKRIMSEGYDLGFVLPNSFSSALMFWLAGVKIRIGYLRDARGVLLTQGVARLKDGGSFRPTYMADYYLKLCYAAGCREESNRLELFTTRESEEGLDALFSRYGIPEKRHTVLVNPGAAYGSSKCWTTRGFVEVVDRLSDKYDCNIILAPGPGEAGLARAIERASNNTIYSFTEDNITLDLLKPLVKRSSLLLTVDSGPRHFAVALGTPTVVLMGPTDYRYTETEWEYGKVIRSNPACAPCHKKVCPADHQCMEDISPQEVFDACVEALALRR